MVKFPGAPGRNWGLAGAGWVLSARAGCSKAPGTDPRLGTGSKQATGTAPASGSRLWGRRHIWAHASQDTCEYQPNPPSPNHETSERRCHWQAPKNGDKVATLFTFPKLINGDVEQNMSPKSLLVLVQTSFCGEVGFGIWLKLLGKI